MARGIDRETRKEIIEDIKDNFLSKEDAALCAGLTEQDFTRHLKISQQLRDDVKRAEALRTKELLKKVMEGDENAKWILVRLNPETFARPSVDERRKPEPPEQEEEHYSSSDNDERPLFGDDHDEVIAEMEGRNRPKRKLRMK